MLVIMCTEISGTCAHIYYNYDYSYYYDYHYNYSDFDFLYQLETVEIPHAGCFTLFQALGSREHDDAGKDSSQGALDKRQVNLQAAVTGANLNGQLQNISVNGS